MRSLLRQLGYRTYGWKLGSNLGPTPKIVDGLEQRFRSIVERNDQPVSIVGWSLGGIYGRQLARHNPDQVRQVVTLGSPFRMRPGDRSAASPIWDSLSRVHDQEALAAMIAPDRPPLTVPTTSIYTRSDGIVRWSMCLESVGEQSENVEVLGSHCGLGFNPQVAMVVADRLATGPNDWRPFRPPSWAKSAFPPPADWEPGRCPAA